MRIYNWLITVWLLGTTTLFAQSSGADIMGWYDVDDYIYNNSNAYPNNFQLLQYDSGYYWLDKNGTAKPLNTFAAGNVFDLTHELWSAVPSDPMHPILPVEVNCSFFWDSLRINYFYLRGSADTSITDTLFIYYYSNFNVNDSQLVFSPVIFGTDTCNAATPAKINYKELSGNYFRKDTVLLKSDDTASVKTGRSYQTIVNKAFNVPRPTKYNYYGLFGYSLTYKPGSPAPLFDTVFDMRDSTAKANVLGVYCSDVVEGFIGGFPPQLWTKIFVQNSFFLPGETRYGGSYHGMRGFLPGLLLPGEPPNIYVRYLNGAAFITGRSCISSIKDVVHEKGLKLFPNPTSPGEILTIKTTDDFSPQATITITDMLGRLVHSETLTPLNLNSYLINAPAVEGIYTVTITDAGNNNSVHTARLFVAR